MSNLIVRVSDTSAMCIGDRDLNISPVGGKFWLTQERVSDPNHDGVSDSVLVWKGTKDECIHVLDLILESWTKGDRFLDIRRVATPAKQLLGGDRS